VSPLEPTVKKEFMPLRAIKEFPESPLCADPLISAFRIEAGNPGSFIHEPSSPVRRRRVSVFC